MIRVASLRYGVIFKKAFCDVEIFTAFVKDILGIEIEITHVETEKYFQPPVGKVATKFDLFAEDKKNRVVVDIQHVRDEDHYDRFLHYHCVALLEQAEKSYYYKPEMRVYTIVVLTSRDKYEADVAITDLAPRTLDGRRLPETQHKLVFLNPKHVSNSTPAPYRQWLRLIADSLDETVDEALYPDPLFHKLFKLIEKDDISPEERARMFEEYNFELFKQSAKEEGRVEGLAEGRAEGLEEGLQKGLEQGKRETALQAARVMLQKGFDRDTVLEITGLRPEEMDFKT